VNNGVVIGISKISRKVSIENGIGIEKILSDQETKKFLTTSSFLTIKRVIFITAHTMESKKLSRFSEKN
jgi:hypothetical protein